MVNIHLHIGKSIVHENEELNLDKLENALTNLDLGTEYKVVSYDPWCTQDTSKSNLKSTKYLKPQDILRLLKGYSSEKDTKIEIYHKHNHFLKYDKNVFFVDILKRQKTHQIIPNPNNPSTNLTPVDSLIPISKKIYEIYIKETTENKRV